MSKAPVLIAYSVKERRPGQKALWTRIGAAWPHDTGAGLTVILDFLPVESRIVLVEPRIDLPVAVKCKRSLKRALLGAEPMKNRSTMSMLWTTVHCPELNLAMPALCDAAMASALRVRNDILVLSLDEVVK